MQVGVLMGDQSPRGRTKLVIALDPNRGNGYTSYIQDVHPVKSQVTLYTHKGSPLWLWLFLSEGPGTRAARGIISITEGSHRFEPSTRARLHEGCDPSQGVDCCLLLFCSLVLAASAKLD